MSREWKPGDVARLSTPSGNVVTYIKTRYDEWCGVDQHGDTYTRRTVDTQVRPLVVIDPEDREAVERLAVTYEHAKPGTVYTADAMQAALREFANPKPLKPEEPTGLGAVVEDDRGRRWVRDHDGFWSSNLGSHQWQSLHGYDARIVRVLSEGVQP